MSSSTLPPQSRARSAILPATVPATPDALTIRDVRLPEMPACQALQRRAWGIIEDGYVVPVATMAAAQKMGGLVLGAFDADERLVGFSFAFLGRIGAALVLYSQLTAVDPDCQGGGIGRQLKLEQRRRAAEMGLATVAWAFDPLQAGNAIFNLAILGATCRHYEVDFYGSRSDALNAGLATDRLLAEWPTADTATPCGGARERWSDGVELIETVLTPEGLHRPTRVRDPVDGVSHLHLAIPASIAAVKQANPGLARAWQQSVRHAFRAAFDAGYVAVGFARGEAPCYLLERAA